MPHKVIVIHADWGEFERWLFVCPDGRFSAEVYKYKDDKTYVLSSLYVQPDCRKQQLGTFLQQYREQYIQSLGGTRCALFCLKNSFQRKWYKRRNYRYWKKYDDDSNYVWLIKYL
jgi:GNAT superfamily N-acetyltransferase